MSTHIKRKFFLFSFLFFTALFSAFSYAHAQTPNTADGTVQPGGSCTTDTNCADINGITYSCQPEGNGNCTYDPSATPNVVQCALDNTIADQCSDCPSHECSNQSNLTCTNGTVAPPNQACVSCPSGGTSDSLADCSSSGGAGTSNANTTLQNPLNATSIVQLLQEVLSYVTYIGSIFLVLVLVYVGFQFVMARGNPEAVQKARTALLWTVIGGLILLGANAISIVIVSTAQSL